MSEDIKACVVGLGKLGLPLAAVIADCGFEVLGVDSSTDHIRSLVAETFVSPEPELNGLVAGNKNRLSYTDDFREASRRNLFFVIVPTPSTKDGTFDDSYLLSAITQLTRHWENIKSEKTIVVVSTVMPGTCVERIHPFLRALEEGELNLVKINLLYSPEFIALGSVVHNLRNPDMTLVGCEDPSQAESFLTVMNQITNSKPKTQILSLTEAEVVKILVNCFVTMKISFANFIGEITSAVSGTDPQKIAKALGMDSRIGGKYLRPGLGFAGPCFPRDNQALIAFARANGLSADLATATDEINKRQPQQVVNRIKEKYPNATSVGIVGIAYKPQTTVVDESQTAMIGKLISQSGLQVTLFDPLVSSPQLGKLGANLTNHLNDLKKCDVIVVGMDFHVLLEGQDFDLGKVLRI